jgi:hypothetical protein
MRETGAEMTICGQVVDVGSLPQWVTVVVAVFALGTAIVSISIQKGIARKRAAIDFFLKTEMDPDAKKSHDEYKKAIDPLRMIVTDKGVMGNSFANTDHYWAIRNYLNLHELLAVGVLKAVFDKKVCYDFWSGELVLAYIEALPLIKYVQAQKNSKKCLCRAGEARETLDEKKKCILTAGIGGHIAA